MLDSNSCIICADSISDPVCRGCYIKQINILLNDFKIDSIKKKTVIKKIQNKFLIESQNNIECILCQIGDVAMCRHCFSILLRNTLRDLDFNEDLIEEFGFNPILEEISLEKFE